MRTSGATRPLPSGRGAHADEPRLCVRRALDTAVRADPYPLWNGIREHGPVWLDGGVVVFSSHAHCAEVLRSPAAHPVVPPAGCPVRAGRTPRPDGARPDLRPGREGPDLARQLLTPQVLAAVEGLLQDRVDDLLDSVAARGRLEAVTDLAYPLPVAAICGLFGLPRADERRLHRMVMPLSRMWEPHPLVDGTEAPGEEEQRRARAALDGYVAELAERRGGGVGEGLIAPVLASLPPGGRPTARQLWELFRELLVSGHESTAALLSNTVMALLRAPHVLEAVRREPDYAEQVVEEVLRADPPFQLLQRRAAADLDVCGVRVPEGTTMLLLLAAAHRDPGLHPAADVFAPGGGSDGHLAFGLGDRFCPGAPLARLAGRLVCVRFAQRVVAPRFATGTPSYRPNVALRGLRALWVDADGFAGRDLPWDRPLPSPRALPGVPEGRAS